MTLTATVYYDIPQLNLGLVLHQHKDIHMPSKEPKPDTEKTSLRSSIKGMLGKGGARNGRAVPATAAGKATANRAQE